MNLSTTLGGSEAHWERMETHLGTYSIVETTLISSEDLPEHYVADEKITFFHAKEAFVTMTAAQELPKLIKIPRGSTVHAYSTYDNTVNNPLNPSNPPQLVILGERTLEKMFVFGFTYIDYQTGDENISLASNVNTATEGLPFKRNSRLYPVYPNPMSRDFSVGFYLDRSMKVNLSIYDLTGRLVKTVLSEIRSTGDHIVPIQLDKQWSAGTYILKLTGDNLSLTQKMVVIE